MYAPVSPVLQTVDKYVADDQKYIDLFLLHIYYQQTSLYYCDEAAVTLRQIYNIFLCKNTNEICSANQNISVLFQRMQDQIGYVFIENRVELIDSSIYGV